MSVRTTEARVKAVMAPGGEYDLTAAHDLTESINAASLITDRVETCAAAKGRTLTAGELATIETWLSAHMYQQSDKGYTSRSTASASGSFQGQLTMGLESTLYGQTALRLDNSGCLSQINGKKVATARSLGRRPIDQVAYEDR